MNRPRTWSVISGFWIASTAVALIPVSAGAAPDDPPAWKVGAAAIKITPEKMRWMSGYLARPKPAEQVVQDFFAKALVIEDNSGQRLTTVTFDLIGIPRSLRDEIAQDLEKAYKIPPKTLWLNASHMHCGPEINGIYIVTEAEKTSEVGRQVQEYADQLRKNVVEVVGQAIARLVPAKLDYLHARAGFAMNRRRPTPRGIDFAAYSDGSVDHDVPVLRVTSADGKTLVALLFGYACHNTVKSSMYCADYPGYAQQYLEESHPGTIALFVQGCGGDQNPYPRGELELSQQHGRTLALAVEAALQTVPRPVNGPLNIAWEEVEVKLAPPPSREELLSRQNSQNQFVRRHAELLLGQLDKEGRLRTTYPFPIQVIRFDKDLTVVALAGDIVVDYSLRLKRELPGPAWIAGYSNDLFAYVPSRRVLEEGGYEGKDSITYSALPGPFDPSVEDQIVGKVLEMVGK